MVQMDKEAFLKLGSREAWDFASAKYKNKEWSFDQVIKALSAYDKLNGKDRTEDLVRELFD